MKLVVLTLSLALSLSTIAAELTCSESCDKTFNDGSLICYKSMDTCMKYSGVAGTERFDMCQDRYEKCLDKKIEIKNICLQNCQ